MNAYAEKQRDKAQEAAQAMQEARTPPIVTTHVFPPIPSRRCDWSAYFEGHEEDGGYGWGATELEAVKDLLANWEPPT